MVGRLIARRMRSGTGLGPGICRKCRPLGWKSSLTMVPPFWRSVRSHSLSKVAERCRDSRPPDFLAVRSRGAWPSAPAQQMHHARADLAVVLLERSQDPVLFGGKVRQRVALAAKHVVIEEGFPRLALGRRPL